MIVAFGLVALAASVYLVFVLEILKFRRFRERELAPGRDRRDPRAHRRRDRREVEREVETGEFQAVSGD